jgi:DNA-binding transcriptional ArsR family regulator
MAAAPVLDLTGRRRALNVEIEASPAYELIISLFGWTSPECRPLLEVGSRWFDDRRKEASPELRSLLDVFADTGKVLEGLVGMLHETSVVHDVGSLFNLLEKSEPDELWATLVGVHERSHGAAVLGADQIRSAAHDPAARRRVGAVLAADDDCGGPGMARIAAAEPADVQRQLIRLLRLWHDEVLADHLASAAPVLERDARAKRALAATLPPERLIEAATDGVSYSAEPGITHILLIPHVLMRPWVLISEYERTKIFAYPVAAESLAAALDEPPPRLVALCKALAEEQRLRIIRRLADGPASLQQIADHLGVAKSTAHHHLVALRAAGLTRVTLGTDKEYSLRSDPVADLTDLLNAYLGRSRR